MNEKVSEIYSVKIQYDSSLDLSLHSFFSLALFFLSCFRISDILELHAKTFASRCRVFINALAIVSVLRPLLRLQPRPWPYFILFHRPKEAPSLSSRPEIQDETKTREPFFQFRCFLAKCRNASPEILAGEFLKGARSSRPRTSASNPEVSTLAYYAMSQSFSASHRMRTRMKTC